jgi:hypothetical protein
MFTTLYENRDKKISQLVKLGDCIGRSLRENVSLFAIDGSNQIVTYITESNKVISGNFSIGAETSITNIRIQDSEIFEDDSVYQKFINSKVSSFVKDIYENDYKSANSNFGEILSLWENRLKFDNVQNKLNEKTEKLRKVEKIMESDEFKRFLELEPQIVQFLKTNFKKISRVPEIRNAVNLSNTISEAFNLQRLDYKTLEEQKTFVLQDGPTSTMYDMICRQELVKKELLESKKEFDTIWASNQAIQKLASCIFEEDAKVIAALSEAIKEVPYVALASKNNLYKTFSSCLASVEGLGVTEKDIQKYASKIFEAKKEVREYLINSLNEKFGINVLNLQDPPSFKSLVNTQIIIFETLSRLAPNGGAVKKTLSELAESLKNKSGVEAIDVNDFIYNMFISSGYGQILDENRLVSKYATIDFKRIAKDLQAMSSVVAGMRDNLGPSVEQDDQYETDENLDQGEMESEEGEEEAPEMEQEPEEMEAPEPEVPQGQEMPPMEGEQAPEEEMGEQVPTEEKNPEQIKADIAKLEAMIKDLADELNMAEGDTPEEEEND